MNKKLKVVILSIFVAIFMFGTKEIFAQIDDEENVNVVENSNLSPDEEGEETKSNAEPIKDNGDGEEVLEGEENKDGEENKTPVLNAAPKAGEGEEVEEPIEPKSEEPKSEESNPEKETPKEETPEEETPEKETPEKETPKEPEIDPNADKDLSELKAQIDAEKDDKKKAELQKEYNEKYLEKVEADGKEKLDKEVVNSFTDSKRNGQYKEIQELYDKIQSDRRDGKLNQEDIDKLNKLLGEFNPPRKLTDEEKKAKDDFNKDYEIPRVEEDKNHLFETYKAARQALKDALDPEKEGVTPEELTKLQEAYAKAKADLDEAIKNKEITPQYTKGKPEIKVYPLDGSTPGKALDGDTYYIPDNTSANLLLEVRKDEGGDFTFTIKPNKTDKTDKNIPDAVLQDLVRTKDGNALTLKKNDDGTYSFKTSNKFTIAQIQMNLPAFRAAFHEGFEITMKAGNQKEVTKKFLITKKGFDDANIGTIGTEDQKKPEEIDAGDTTDGVVDKNTKKVFDIFTFIKQTDGYIDDVIVNSNNGETLPLSYVDITITLPKYNKEFAEYLYKSGLEYQELEEGKYQLKLQMKNIGGNLTKDEDGNLIYNGEKLTKAELKDKILEEAGKKVYVDSEGKTHEIETEKYYEITDDKGNVTFVVKDGKLYKKDADGKDELVGEFKDGKLKKDGTTYLFNDGKLISYTDEKDVYEGNVSNKKEKGDSNKKEKDEWKADINVTPTFEGDQIIVKDEKGNDAYGGTVIENGIFDEKNKYTGKNSSDKEYQGFEIAYVDGNGKRVDGPEKGEEVTNAVFNKEGYIVSGLKYKKGRVLIDKFGNILDDITVGKNGENYTFKKGKETKETDGTNLKVENGKKFVKSDNSIIADEAEYEGIVGKYYFDGKKFVGIKDDAKGLVGKKFYTNFKTLNAVFKIVDSYKNGEEKIELGADKKVYHGSINPEDYVTVGDKTYVKRTSKEGFEYYVNVNDTEKVDVLSLNNFGRVVQIYKDGKEKLSDETDIYEAVKNAKFQIKFPGFLAGEKVVYKLHADITAKYLVPNPEFNPKEKESEENPRFIETSIFKDKDGKPFDEKKIDKYFTLKVKEGSPASFFKNPPKELLESSDYNFFNVFYREKSDQKTRDEYIKHLLVLDRKDDKNKKDILILDKIQSELGRLYDGAKFALNDKQELVILDKEGKETKIERSLLWEVGFNNPGGALFPENKDESIVVTDSNMDNRLVYDEIIVNDIKDNWKDAKKAWEDAEKAKKEKDENYKEKAFEGTEEYFFIDQIKEIQFGVNSFYTKKIFTAAGENFTLTSKDILDALKNAGINNSTVLEKGGIKYQITRDTVKGQIRIKVLNAFYKKVENDENHKFESPVQEKYQNDIKDAIKTAKKLDDSSRDKLKESFDGLIKKLYKEDSDCYNVLNKKFNSMIEALTGEGQELTDKLTKIKDSIIKEIEKAELGYLDTSKGEYKFDDFRFNAIRFKFNPDVVIGGAMEKVKTKKIGITSVIIPDIDIPYTDEFGKALTNKDKYVQEEIGKIKAKNNWSDKEFKKAMQNEDTFRDVMKKAYEAVNKMDSKTFKKLVTIDDTKKYGRGKYTVTAGKDLDFEDLANDKNPIHDSKGQPLNPYYIVDKDGNVQTIEDKIKSKKVKESKAYDELLNSPIDIAGYYMSKLGYNRAMYGNKANFFLIGGKSGSAIFGNEDGWKKKICRHGILGHCIENAGNDGSSKPTEGEDEAQEEMEAESEFELSYTPPTTTTDEENPKVDKKSDTDKVNVSEEADKKVDFTIDVTVDKMKKDQKELADVLKGEKSEINKDDYTDEGYYKYNNGLIIDILPDIFEFTKESEVTVEVNDGIYANGANKDLKLEKFKKDIKYVYTEDVKAYLAELKAKDEDEKYNVLLKALGGDESKIKDGQKAILAWLPEFEAPHGSKNQMQLKITNLLVNKEKYKESENNNNQGQPYTNKGGFGNEAEFLFGTKTITITDGHNANVNKYLQLLDKNGNVIKKDEAGEWFKGSATLKFGDKFNYKIKYYLDNKGLINTGFEQKDTEWELKDLFDGNKGLRPVLRDFVEVPDGFTVLYKVNGTYKEASQITKADLAKVEGIKINPPTTGFPYNESREFILPMMIPELDAKIENGKVIYKGTDGKDVVLGDAKDFFNLDNLTNKDAKMYFENKVDKSNTVTVYLEKERFIKLFKEFFEADKKTEIKENRPEVQFDIWQIVKDEDGKVVERIKLDKGLTLNEKNKFIDQVNHLPLFKRIEEVDEKGKVTVKILSYTYEVEEQQIDGYTGKVFKFDETDAIGFVLKAENYKKPDKPEEPNNPPEEPDKPEEPDEPINPNEPNQPGYPGRPGEPNLPKTGVKSEMMNIWLGFIMLLGLCVLKKKLYVK